VNNVFTLSGHLKRKKGQVVFYILDAFTHESFDREDCVLWFLNHLLFRTVSDHWPALIEVNDRRHQLAPVGSGDDSWFTTLDDRDKTVRCS
jgi:hypothetical protein